MNNPHKTVVRIEKATDAQPWDVVHFSGPMDENGSVFLTPLFKDVGRKVVFAFKNVSFINSNGIRCWVLFLREFKADRTIEFTECAPVVVSQMNMLPSFRQKVAVRSVYVPFTCSNAGCKQVSDKLFLAKDFPVDLSELEPSVCQKCGSPSAPEELEEDYFGFTEL